MQEDNVHFPSFCSVFTLGTASVTRTAWLCNSKASKWKSKSELRLKVDNLAADWQSSYAYHRHHVENRDHQQEPWQHSVASNVHHLRISKLFSLFGDSLLIEYSIEDQYFLHSDRRVWSTFFSVQPYDAEWLELVIWIIKSNDIKSESKTFFLLDMLPIELISHSYIITEAWSAIPAAANQPS